MKVISQSGNIVFDSSSASWFSQDMGEVWMQNGANSMLLAHYDEPANAEFVFAAFIEAWLEGDGFYRFPRDSRKEGYYFEEAGNTGSGRHQG